ncbi:MAG: hypothetical protein C5B51_13455 [Terriglobia bacterium]|nr:MAG: hypothetical protein C5B51_13455 [Terriglobia bacterium]
MANHTLLLVESNPIELKMMAAALRAEGWRVQVASNGEQALTTLRTSRPEMVLSALKLPGMSGFELAGQIKQNAQTSAILVVGTSASAADESSAREVGCDGFLEKPIDVRQIGDRLQACLKGQAPSPPATASPTPGPAPAGTSSEANQPVIPVPELVSQALRGRRVALIGFAEKEAELICAALERVEALPRLLQAWEQAGSEIVASCRLILVHARSESASRFAARVPLAPDQALVLVGTREALLTLDHEVQARAAEFLIDGWQPEEAILRLSMALTRNILPVEKQAVPRRRGSPLDGAEILIVDDDIDVRTLIRASLTRNGVECRVAANGAEALEMLERRQPTAMILDVNMPVMDGFETLVRVRERGLDLPVLMLTARQQEKDVLLGFDLGANDYVVKPFNPPELIARLKRLI